MAYPASVRTFPPIVDGVDFPEANDLNPLYTEVTAIEQGLLNGVAHDLIPTGTRNIGSSGVRWNQGWFNGNVTTAAQFAGSGAGLTNIPLGAITNGTFLTRANVNETITGIWTFDTRFLISADPALFRIFDEGSSVGNRAWQVIANESVFRIQATADDFTGAFNALQLGRGGNLTLGGRLIAGAAIVAVNGTAGSPGIKFADASTGWYRGGTNVLSASTAGVQRFRIETGEVSVMNANLEVEDTFHVANQPRALLRNAGTQSIPNDAATACTFNTEVQDFGNMHSLGQPSRVTVPAGQGGLYLLAGSVQFASNAAGNRQCRFAVDGGISGPRRLQTADQSAATNLHLVDVLPLSAGDFVEFMVVQNSGGSLAIGHATDVVAQTTLRVVKLF